MSSNEDQAFVSEQDVFSVLTDLLGLVRVFPETAEDPVEYVIDGISQCSINPKCVRTPT